MNPPLRYAGPDTSGPDRQASVWRCHCLARAPFAHRINAVCILNGTATPTAVLGEDLSGSSPDGSAFNTHGPFLVLCAARNTRDTPVRDVPEGESSISRGGVLAHRGGFGTFGWTGTGR